MKFRLSVVALVIVGTLLVPSASVLAQVTTATLYGVVRDTSGGILPGVNVSVLIKVLV